MIGYSNIATAGVAAVASIGSVVYTIRQRRADDRAAEMRRNDPELNALEKAAYERARASYEAALRTAQNEAARLESRMTITEGRAERAEEASRHALARAEAAETVARRQGRTLRALRAWLRQNGVQIPAHLDGDDKETD